ncbi:unnamed protein product [Linum tenue]|nr:unnamed protein product [Linum tenue]
MSAADKVRTRQFDHASGLLGLCNSLAPSDGNTVERVVHCFSKALRTKIAKETATTYDMTSNKEFVIDENQLISDKTFMTFHQTVPFHQVQHIAATQAILDNVERATKIHVVDLQIRNGLEWITLMQALESRQEYPVEHLKITALVIGSGSAIEYTKRTGDQLKSFAETINIPLFSFHVVQIPDLKDFRAGLFETDPEEALVVFSEFFFNKFTSRPVELDRAMREIKIMNPRVMVMIETEANHNSPSFSSRFVETLFHYSAFFDCLEACMSPEHEPDRRIMETVIVTELVTNMLAAEGEERGMRSVKLDTWRSFFARFGMVEQELSDVLLYQVKLVTGKCSGWKFCTTNWDDGSLTIGWKGTPMTSVSVWKFVRTARLVSGPKDLVVEFV